MYLETIYILTEHKPTVRAVEVGEYMGYSKPSVSRAMGLLRRGGLITVGEDGGIALTEEGRQVAAKMYDRHNLLTRCFMLLGVDEETAVEDACKIEHHISDASFEAIRRFVENS